MLSKTPHMHFVNDGSRRRQPQRCITFPVVGCSIDHYALHRGGRIVTGFAGGATAVIVWNAHCATIGVEKDLRCIESHTARWIPWPLDAISIDLAGRHARDEHMPIMVRAIGRGIDANHACST